MKSHHSRSALHGIGAGVLLVLAACATVPPPAPAPDYDDAMALGRTHASAGQVRDAVTALQRAAAMEPANKQPWLEIAQLRAGQGRHVDALAAAEQVLRRDPADAAAYDIMVGSGLQVALRTLERLQAAGRFPGQGRTEQARRLGVLIADVFGPEVLVPEEIRKRLAHEAVESYKASRAERLPESERKPKGDPLDLLGGDPGGG